MSDDCLTKKVKPFRKCSLERKCCGQLACDCGNVNDQTSGHIINAYFANFIGIVLSSRKLLCKSNGNPSLFSSLFRFSSLVSNKIGRGKIEERVHSTLLTYTGGVQKYPVDWSNACVCATLPVQNKIAKRKLRSLFVWIDRD